MAAANPSNPQTVIDPPASSTLPPSGTPTDSPTGEAGSGDPAPDEVLEADTAVSCSSPEAHFQQRTLELINAARAEARHCGSDYFQAAAPVTWNTLLVQAALSHSQDMAKYNFFDHTGSDGSTIGTRVTSTGYRWSTVGENIAAGQQSASMAVAGWIDSPGHCRNLMNPAFTEVALACTDDTGSDFVRYWTNVLAAPR